jgi:hypothetical protein
MGLWARNQVPMFAQGVFRRSGVPYDKSIAWVPGWRWASNLLCHTVDDLAIRNSCGSASDYQCRRCLVLASNPTVCNLR